VREWLAASPTAAGALISRATRVDLVGEASAAFANLDLPALGWRDDAAPIVVLGGVAVSVSPAPKSLAGMVVVSRELLRRSNAAQLLDAALRRSAAMAIESRMFSTSAAIAAAPAGLLVGVTPAAATGSIGGDLGVLARAVSGTTNQPIFVGSPENAMAARIAAPGVEVLRSTTLAEGTVVAIAPEALGVVVGEELVIETSDAATIHMSDVPLEIVADGGPTADPVRSLLQTNSLALRIMIDVNWAALAPARWRLSRGRTGERRPRQASRQRAQAAIERANEVLAWQRPDPELREAVDAEHALWAERAAPALVRKVKFDSLQTPLLQAWRHSPPAASARPAGGLCQQGHPRSAHDQLRGGARPHVRHERTRIPAPHRRAGASSGCAGARQAMTTMTDEQAVILRAAAAWLDEEVQRLVRCGLTHAEAARVHNDRMKRYRVDQLLTRLVNADRGSPE
jgi:hypothetical protein